MISPKCKIVFFRSVQGLFMSVISQSHRLMMMNVFVLPPVLTATQYNSAKSCGSSDKEMSHNNWYIESSNIQMCNSSKWVCFTHIYTSNEFHAQYLSFLPWCVFSKSALVLNQGNIFSLCRYLVLSLLSLVIFFSIFFPCNISMNLCKNIRSVQKLLPFISWRSALCRDKLGLVVSALWHYIREHSPVEVKMWMWVFLFFICIYKCQPIMLSLFKPFFFHFFFRLIFVFAFSTLLLISTSQIVM